MKDSMQVAVVLFYDSEGNILLQDRRGRSKWGEEYSFFGGTSEPGETPKQTIVRELKEELELENVELELYKNREYTNPIFNIEVKLTAYLAKIPDMKEIVCHEGKPEIRQFKNSLNLKMIPGSGHLELLNEIYHFLKLQNKTI